MAILESKTVTKGVLVLTASISVDAMQPYLERAASDLQKEKPVTGFRPGKAPYQAVVNELGAMKVWETAARRAIAAGYAELVTQEHFETIGDPEFQLLKLSPAQPLEFQVTVALLPAVELGDYANIRVKTKPITIDEKEITDVLTELQDMRASTAAVDRPATLKDRVLVDLAMSKAGVPIDGGTTKNHAIDLHKPYFIPGFAEQVVGLKAGEQKKFLLPFPKDHYDKNLAGAMIDFDVTVNAVHEFTRPPLDEAFAKSVGGFASVEALKEQLSENLRSMQQSREDQRVEREIIDAIIKKSTFGELPNVLVEAELQKIMWRLKSQVEREGGNWNDYLTHLNKKPDELVAEWLPEAETRVKAQLIVRSIAEKESIHATPEEIEAERQLLLAHYPKDEDAEFRSEIQSPEYDAHLKHLIVTRKVMTLLRNSATAA